MRARYVVGGLAIVIAVAVWAVDMASFQPEVERLTIAENNSHWARDLRHAAMFLAFAGLVLLAEGRLIAALTGFGAMVGWGTADIFLDKADLDAFGSGIAAVIIAGTFGTLAWYLNTAGIVRPDNQSVLFFTAAVSVFFVTMVSFAQTPDDIVPDRLAITSAIVAVALVIVACTLAGTATVHIGRWAATALALSLLPLGVIAYRRAYGEPMDLDFFVLTFGPAIVMLAALTWLAGRWPKDPRRLAGVIALLMFFVPVLATVGTLIAVVTSLGIAGELTAAAGNPPVNAADSDLLMGLVALVAGTFNALLLLVATQRPDELGRQVTPKFADDGVGVS